MELEQLKQQWDILNKKLDEQQIINKRLMENAVRQKIDFINSYNWVGVIIGLAVIPLLLFLGQEKKLDTPLIYSSVGIMIIFTLWGIHKALQFNKTKSFKHNVISTEKFILKLERISFWYYVGTLVFLFGFLIISFIVLYDRLAAYNRVWIFASVIVVGISAGIYEMKWYLGKVKNLHQSISDLKEFEKE